MNNTIRNHNRILIHNYCNNNSKIQFSVVNYEIPIEIGDYNDQKEKYYINLALFYLIILKKFKDELLNEANNKNKYEDISIFDF